MKKSNLKKAFALSALMAFVITGSAYAADVNVGEEKTEEFTSAIVVDSDQSFYNAGTVNADQSITVDKGSFTNTSTGTINTTTLDIWNKSKIDIAGTINASDKIIYRGVYNGNFYDVNLSAKLDTPELRIIGTDWQTGLNVLNNEVLANVDNIFVESHGAKTGLIIGSQKPVTVAAPIYLQHEEGTDNDARVEVYGGSSITANNLIALSGKTKFQLNNNSSAVLNNVEVKDGVDFSLQTLGTESDTAEFNLNTITVGDNAEFKTSIYGTNSSAHITGNDVTINLGKNAKADFGGVGDGTKADWLGNKIDFDVDKLTINMDNTDEYVYTINDTINEYKKDYSKGVYIHVNDKYNPLDDSIGCDRITVVGSSSNNTGNIENDLQRLAYVVKITQEKTATGEEATALPDILYPTGAHVEQNPGGIDDGGKGTVDDKGNVDQERLEASWEFYKFVTSSENTMSWALNTSGYFPIRTSALESDAYKEITDESSLQPSTVEILRARTYNTMSDIRDSLYTTAVFPGSNGTRNAVGTLMTTALTIDGTPITDAELDAAFNTAYENSIAAIG